MALEPFLRRAGHRLLFGFHPFLCIERECLCNFPCHPVCLGDANCREWVQTGQAGADYLNELPQ